MLRKPQKITTTTISITEELLRIFRIKYQSEHYKGDSEAVCQLIRKYTGDTQ